MRGAPRFASLGATFADPPPLRGGELKRACARHSCRRTRPPRRRAFRPTPPAALPLPTMQPLEHAVLKKRPRRASISAGLVSADQRSSTCRPAATAIGRHRPAVAVGEEDQAAAAVAGVGAPFDIAELLQLLHRLWSWSACAPAPAWVSSLTWMPSAGTKVKDVWRGADRMSPKPAASSAASDRLRPLLMHQPQQQAERRARGSTIVHGDIDRYLTICYWTGTSTISSRRRKSPCPSSMCWTRPWPMRRREAGRPSRLPARQPRPPLTSGAT